MSRDVTKSGGGSLSEAPKLSPELQKILNRRKVVASYGGDDGVGSHGANFSDGVWDQPEWVDARERDEAKAKLPGFDPLLRPWTHDQIRQQFLLPLWGATKHQGDASWDAVSIVYPMFLDSMPGWCFRRDRLLLASQHVFSWFPSVQELVAFMEPDRRAIVDRVEMLRKVSESPTSPPSGTGDGEPWSVEKAEAWGRVLSERKDRERREMIETMREIDEANGDPPAETIPPEQAPLESDKDYVRRLCAWHGQRISEGDKARKRDEARYRRAKEMTQAERRSAARPSPPPTSATMDQAHAEFRKTHEHGPPMPSTGKAGKAEKSVSSPDDRLSNFPDEPLSPEDY